MDAPETHEENVMRWRIMLATALVAASGGAVLLGAGTASAAVGSPLVSAASGRCLDVSGNNPAAGTPVAIWDCNGQQNQGWVFTIQGELRTFNETRCLDLPSATAGTPLPSRTAPDRPTRGSG